MAANKMPLMLDNSMPVDLNDVDDLFGDGVGLSLPVRAQSKQLRQRLDELRGRGCCQAVAWSKAGTIASITADGQAIELRFLRCSPVDGSWDLSEPTICQNIKGTPSIPLVHLEWSPTTSPDLAVIDALGRVAIITFTQYLNHPFVTRKWDADPVDDTHSVAGCYWLAVSPAMLQKQQPYNILYGPATKHGNSYQYESSFIHVTGPNHPISSRSALLCVTTSGMLKMFWSQSSNKVEETAMELESVNSSDDLVTHAAIASDRKFLLLAIVTSSLQLSLLKIDIQWLGAESQTDKNTPLPPGTRLNPSLVEKHIATTSWLQSALGDTSNGSSVPSLTHLQVLPSIMNNTGKSMVPPMVIAIRSRASTPGSYDVSQTILDRWEAVEQRQGLHPAFEQLGSRRNSISSELPNATQLRKLEPITIEKVLINFHTIHFGKVIVLTFADASVEYRDRFTFEEIYNSESLTKVMMLRQASWAFTENGPCQHVAFSPTQSSMVQLGDDGKVRWSKLHYPPGDIGNTMQEGNYGATVAALAIATAFSVWYQNNFDDLLAIMQPFTGKKRFITDWITDVIRILKIQVDYSEEVHHESLMRNAPLQSCLSIMNSLGFKGEMHPRSFQSKFAMLNLNLRNVGILITLASNTPFKVEKMTPLDEPEVVEALAGCAKWSLDLIAWLIDSLFELAREDNFIERLVPQRFGEMTMFLREKNDVSLHLLLSSSSRSFLLATCRRISHLDRLSSQAIEFYRKNSLGGDTPTTSKTPSPHLQRAYQRMQHIIAAGLIRVSEFEKLLNVVGSDVKQAYQEFLPSLVRQQANAPQGRQLDQAIKTTQIQMEMGMMLGGSPPPPFLPVIKKFFNRDLPSFRKLTDPAKLFFGNYDLLQMQDGPDTRRVAKSIYVDVFKKEEIQKNSKHQWRRCTRCAAVMEDVTGTRPGFVFVLSQQRKCSCSGCWGIMPKGKLTL